MLPKYLRELRPRATILTFWHIPWPNAERFGICPWERELLEGMLGASIVGFHTQAHCNNFVEAIDRFLESRIDRERQSVVLGGRETLVRAYPISIEWPSHWAAGTPAGRGVPGDGAQGAGARARRRARRRGRPDRLHEGDRGAAARGRALPGALPVVGGTVHLRPGGRPEPDGHRSLPRAQRAGGGARGADQRALRQAAAGARSRCCAATTSRRRSSGSTARPTSATCRASTTA